MALLRRRAEAEAIEALLLAWWVELADQPPELARKMRINREGWSRMMLDLDKTLDVQQRQNVLDKLDLFITELGELVPGPDTRETGPADPRPRASSAAS